MRAQAIVDIEYLRRRYAKATDLIGLCTDEAIAEGRATYREIFAPDAYLTAGVGEDLLEANGPDEWVDVVAGALEEYSATQHLIGTQIVDFATLEADANGTVAAGEATLESYLHAWHEKLSDGTVWVFIGRYVDQARFTPGAGWQIHKSELVAMSSETRLLGTL